MTPTDTLSFSEVEASGLGDWRQLFYALHTRFLTGDFGTGVALVNAIGALAEEANHHPDLDLRYPHLNVSLMSHDVFGVTSRDVDLALAISAAAVDLGVAADPQATGVVEIALDTWDLAEIKPFWRAVLDLVDSPASEQELLDLSGRRPTLWFQHTSRHDEPRQRFHLDIRVPPEVAQARVAAALEAGGVVVTTEHEPAFTVLADAQGNKVCVTTGRGRE